MVLMDQAALALPARAAHVVAVDGVAWPAKDADLVTDQGDQ
jgi:hypothetical protein